MRYVRRMCLALLAALALTAFAGAASAPAAVTALCDAGTSEPYCLGTDVYPKGTALTASSSEATIDVPEDGGTIKCTESSLEGTATAAMDEPLTASVSAWSLDGCSEPALEGSTCAVTTENLPYAGSIAWTAEDDGSLAVGDGGKGHAGWKIKCTWLGLTFIDCTYGVTSSLRIEGGNPGKVVASNETLSEAGQVCPGENLTFTSTYTIDSPQPMHVATIQDTLLCEAAEVPCAEANRYPSGTQITAESIELELSNEEYEGSCKDSAIGGETTAESGAPLSLDISQWTLTCLFVSSWCGGEAQGLPYTGSLIYSGESSGYLGVVGPEWLFRLKTCAAAIDDCTFKAKADELATEFVGGAPGQIRVDAPLERAAGWCVHGAEATLKGVYEITSPNPVYVSTP